MAMKKTSGGDSPLWQGVGKSFWTCRGYNPGYTKVPLYLLLIYITYQVMCCRNIEKQINSSLGRINQAQAGINSARPDYGLLGRYIGGQAGISMIPGWAAKVLPGWAGACVPPGP
jgi:hypothetical protein